MTTPALWATLRPPPLRTPSEWADAERVLSIASTAQPGPWRTSITPYLREPMDRMSAWDPCERVVLMFGSQLGKTEAILNAIGYIVCDAPGPILMVQPTEPALKVFSRQRIASMIAATPALSARFAPARGRDGASSLEQRDFAGGVPLILRSAQTPAGLASMPIRYVLLDEVDRYPASAGAEGDPVELAIQRTMAANRRKIMMTSTPTVRGRSRIEAAMQETGWRVYELPCPHCAHWQPWEWEALRWEPGRWSSAMLHCRACGAGIAEHHKRELLPLGRWTPLHPEREDGRTYGYHISTLCAPYGWTAASWPALAERWDRSAHDTERRRTVVNLALARTYDETEAATVDPIGLLGRREQYAAPVPAGAVALTAGADVQQDRIEVSVWGWGAADESWLIEHLSLTGDPTGPQVWCQLDDVLMRRYRHESGATIAIDAACVDSGYLAQEVQAWCAARLSRRIYATKGSGDGARALWPARASRGHTRRPVWLVGVAAGKDSLWRRIQRREPGPGYIHIPSDVDEAWCEQILAERPRQHAGQTQWVRERGVRAEALDCAVYAHAALASLGPTARVIERATARLDTLPRVEHAHAPRPTPATTPAATKPPPRPAQRQPQRQSWLSPGARLR